MACAKHAVILTAFGISFLPAVALGQEQTPKIQIHTGVDPQALFNSSLEALGESEQEVVGYHVMLSDEQSEANPLFEATGMNGGELLRRRSPLAFLQDSSTGASDLSADAGGFVGGRLRALQQTLEGAHKSLTVLEGNSKKIRINLDRKPSGEVTGTITGHENTDLDVNPTQLTFTPSNWNVKQEVTVDVKQDSDDANEAVKLTFTLSGNSTNSTNQEIYISILDDERPWELVPQTVLEGSLKMLRVPLLMALAPPSGEVTFTITGHENTNLTLNKTTLIFPVVSGPQFKSLILGSTPNTDQVDEHVMLTFTASGGGYTGLKYTVDVTIIDRPPWEILIPEGGTARYSPSLGGQSPPSVDPIAIYTGHENTDLTVNPKQFTFKVDTMLPCNVSGVASFCSDSVPATLTASEDSDDVDDQVLLLLTLTGPPLLEGLYMGASRLIYVRIEDNDDPGLIVKPSSLQISEGGSGQFTVKLSEAPLGDLGSNDVTVTIPYRTENLTVDKTRLTFTTSNWNTEQIVTLTAGHDSDFEDHTGILWMTASGGGYDHERGSVAWEIIDDDTPGLRIWGTVNVPEGRTDQISVDLTARPPSNVKVEITGYAGTDLDTLVSTPRKLTFTPSNWDQRQTVTFGAKHDADHVNDTEILTLTATGGFTDTKIVTGSIRDDDVPTLVVTSTSVEVNEGASETFKVRLNGRPHNNAEVSISGYADTDLDTTVSAPRKLTFMPSDWNQTQTVTLGAKHDTDFVNDAAMLTLKLRTRTLIGSFVDSETVNVTIKDDDSPGLVVTPTLVEVDEGESATFTVKLNVLPANDVTVAISVDQGIDGKLDLDPIASTTLTFNSSDWNEEQTVTLTAQHDADFVNNEEILTLTATGDLSDTKTVNVIIIDDDSPGLVVTPTLIEVDEGESATFTVELEGAPSSDVEVDIFGYADTDLDTTASAPRKLTFTTSDWDQAQTVTLRAKHDADFVDDAAILTLTATNTDTKTVNVDILDDDEAGMVVDPQSVIVAEGKTERFKVKLGTQPSGNVTVTIPTPVGDLTPVPSMLRFTADNWNIFKTVTLMAADDEDFTNDTLTLTLTAKSGGYDDVKATITVTITDDDHAPSTSVMVSLSASPNPVEEGSSVTITATLSKTVPDAVTIELTDTPGEPPTEPGDYNPLERITIPGGALAGSGTIVIRDDDVSEGEERFTVAIDALPSGVERGNPSSVEIAIQDNDPTPPVEVTLSASPNPVNEGKSVTITATLTGMLETDVVVPLVYNNETNHPPESGDYTQVSGIVIFRGKAQGSGQIQTFMDADMDDETFSVALGDLPSALLVPGREPSQTLTIQDITSSAAVTVDLSASPNSVDEGGYVTVTATLSEALDTNVEIPLTLTDGTADDEDYHASPPVQVEIEAGKTNGPYRISTIQDAVAEEDETFTVALGTLPSGLVKGDQQSVELTITDDDKTGIEVPPSVSLLEGGETSFDISLTSVPLGDVVVTMNWPEGTDLIVSPITRIFTPESWDEGQQVTLRAADDADMMYDQVEVTLTASGGGYTGISETVSVTITDDDTPGIVAPASVTMAEGSQRALAIALAQMPSGLVTVTFGGHSGTDLALDQSSLTFTTTNWNEVQTVMVTAGEDDDFVDDTETLMLTASGGGYTGVTVAIPVTIEDNDVAGLLVEDQVQLEEGGTYQLMVHLSAQPLRPVTMTFTGHAGTDLTLDKPSLTFTAADWNTSKAVTLTAAEDDEDYADETVDLKVTASGGGYDGVTADITVTIMDNDERPGPLTITLYDEQVLEHVEAIQLPIELSRPVDQVVMVQYTSTAGTAEAGLDYMTSRGIVIFDPGATRGVIEIEVIDDELPEEHETFMVTLSKPRNAIIARETGTGTILDDDGASAILRVEDALVLEEEGMVRFRVLLSHPQRRMISAAYRTRDGTAKAGEDYEASSGVVTLAPGTVEAMIAVPLLKDGLDWREETFTVHLVSSKHAEIAKAVGVATIQESSAVSEKVFEAYAARFVRTSSVQVVEALGERFRSRADGAACGAADRAEMARLWYSASSWDPSLGELLAGCRMSATSYSGSFSVWGRGAFRQFNGRDDDALTLRGEVTTGMLGADYRWRGGWLAGLLLAHSQGEGSFEVVQQSGEITAGLTGVYPYVSYARAGWDVWLSAGAGRGQAEVLELKGDLVSRFGAMGVRGKLMSSGTIGLNYHGDVLVTDAEIKEHEVTAEVYRVRAGVEANVKISDGLRPFVEANVRSDGGSAETGVGLEFGGGIRVAYPAWHLQADLRTQGLVMHTADGFTEWGISGSVQVGSRSEGLMMRVRPSWGRGQGMSMYGQQTILDAVPIGADAQRTELELGYGIPWKDGTARSVMGVTQLSQGVMYRLGGELHPTEWLTFSIFGLAHGRATALGNLGVNVRGSLRY